mgnify:FL=1
MKQNKEQNRCPFFLARDVNLENDNAKKEHEFTKLQALLSLKGMEIKQNKVDEINVGFLNFGEKCFP